MKTIDKIIHKLEELDGHAVCFVQCEYIDDYPEHPGLCRFDAVFAYIHEGSDNCVDFSGDGCFISSNNLENEDKALSQLWEQIKNR